MAEKQEKEPIETTYTSLHTETKEREEESPQARGLTYQLARIISVIMHPLFMPGILFALVFYFGPRVTAPLTSEYRLPMLGILLLTTLLIPLLSVIILHYLGSLPSLSMTNRKERVMPFLYISIFYAFTTYFFITKYQRFLNINIMLAGISFVIIFITVITFYWKVSAHSAAAGGVTGFLASFMILYQEMGLIYPLVAMVFLTGAVMSARLYLNEHRPVEVWVGVLLGFSVCCSSVFFFSLA